MIKMTKLEHLPELTYVYNKKFSIISKETTFFTKFYVMLLYLINRINI